MWVPLTGGLVRIYKVRVYKGLAKRALGPGNLKKKKDERRNNRKKSKNDRDDRKNNQKKKKEKKNIA